MTTAEVNDAAPNWSPLVRRIAAGDAEAIEQLYNALQGLRYHFERHVGTENADDFYHELLVDLVSNIREGVLREPQCLVGYARSIARHKICAYIGQQVSTRKRRGAIDPELRLTDPLPDPEAATIRREQVEVAQRILAALPPRDREVLIRFYLKEQSPERILSDLVISATQFRLIKSRAKQRFTDLLQNRLNRRPPSARAVGTCGGERRTA